METRVIFSVSELMFFNPALNIDKAASRDDSGSPHCARGLQPSLSCCTRSAGTSRLRPYGSPMGWAEAAA